MPLNVLHLMAFLLSTMIDDVAPACVVLRASDILSSNVDTIVPVSV